MTHLFGVGLCIQLPVEGLEGECYPALVALEAELVVQHTNVQLLHWIHLLSTPKQINSMQVSKAIFSAFVYRAVS